MAPITLGNLKEQLDEKTRIKLMESCGRDCARRGAGARLAESSKGNVDKALKQLAVYIGKENCYREGATVHLTYPKCFCELVAEGPDKLPDTYCLCSRGWILELFEGVTQKPVKVEAIQTIKQGAPSCKFIVRLK